MKDPLEALQIYRLYKDYTMQELLDDLDVIERFEQPGRPYRIGEMTRKQMDLYRYLGVEPPTLVKLCWNSGYMLQL